MVDRCVCKSISFSRLKELADQGHGDLDALSKKTGCGTGCGMCVPYIRVSSHDAIRLLNRTAISEYLGKPPAIARQNHQTWQTAWCSAHPVTQKVDAVWSNRAMRS